MARYSLISYHDPKIDSWTIPQPIQGVSDEAIDAFIQNMQRTIKAGKVAPENDGFECFRIAIFDDDTGQIIPCPSKEHLIDLHAPNMKKEEGVA